MLSAMPSPLDVLPCSLLKTYANVFASVIARLANLSPQAGKFPVIWYSITHSLFLSRLKTFLLYKSFPL